MNAAMIVLERAIELIHVFVLRVDVGPNRTGYDRRWLPEPERCVVMKKHLR